MLESSDMSQSGFNSFLKKVFTSGPLTLETGDKPESPTDKEELINYLLEIRKIRTDTKEAHNRRLFALNPMVKDYNERAGRYRSEVVKMQAKINLIDDIINWINQK